MWIATREQCRQLDQKASELFGISTNVLMERAGLAISEAAHELLQGQGRIAIACGKGNNGGDGFVAARLLKDSGYTIDCFVASEELSLGAECHAQMLQAKANGIDPVFSNSPRYERKLSCLGHYDLIIDALLGTGAQGEIREPVKSTICAINRSGVPVLAVDIPSGIDSDTGQELGSSIWALRTVTFGLPKPFLFQNAGLEKSGYWTVAQIGFPRELLTQPKSARLILPTEPAELFPERLRDSHKGENGKILIVAGSHEMRGAAVLSALAALKSGAGLVTVAGIESVCSAVSNHCPEVTLMVLPEVEGALDSIGSERLINAQSEFTSSLFGPGLSQMPSVSDFLARTWARWEVPTVIDADALNWVSRGVQLPPAPCILTPHPGEMARLLNQNVSDVQSDRFSSVQNAVSKFNQTIILKGPHSIVGSPYEPMIVNQTGNPGMASGGSGDVLGGVCATLLGQELPPHDSAILAMAWHGLAGDLCAQQIGRIGFTASELATKLPEARAKLQESC